MLLEDSLPASQPDSPFAKLPQQNVEFRFRKHLQTAEEKSANQTHNNH